MRHLKTRNAELLLAGVIIARATSLLLSKLSMRNLGPFTLMGLRFTLSFLVLGLIFRKRFLQLRFSTLLRGIALGGTFFAVMSCELIGLKLNDSSSMTSFLENTAVVWVPLMEAALLRHTLHGRTLLSAGLTLLGVGLLTLGGGSLHFGPGELLCIAASVLYAFAILLTAQLSREDDPLLLGIFQVGFIGLFGLSAAFLFEIPSLPQSAAQWGAVVYLALVCSCFGFTLQPVAQRYVSAERAGLFCALNPLTAAVLGVLFLHEKMGPASFLGGVLILSGILLQGIPPKKKAGIRKEKAPA